MEITAEKQNKQKRMKNIENSLRDFWDNIKHTNIEIVGVSEEEENKKIFEEVIVENFSNMGEETVNQVRDTQRVPYRMNPKRNNPRHILIKQTKTNTKKEF